jgi:mono/diheme cytochrome c family protein
LLALACESAPGPEPPAADPMLAEMGSELFARHCATCHGVEGLGDGPVAGELRTPPADLTRIAVRRGGVFPEGEMARFIDGRFDLPVHGTREMPIWGRRFGADIPEAELSEEVVRGNVAILVEYLKTLQRTD